MHNSTGYVIKQLVHAFSMYYQVLEHVGSLESTKESYELPKAIAKDKSSFLSALQTSHVLHNSIVHS